MFKYFKSNSNSYLWCFCRVLMLSVKKFSWQYKSGSIFAEGCLSAKIILSTGALGSARSAESCLSAKASFPSGAHGNIFRCCCCQFISYLITAIENIFWSLYFGREIPIVLGKVYAKLLTDDSRQSFVCLRGVYTECPFPETVLGKRIVGPSPSPSVSPWHSANQAFWLVNSYLCKHSQLITNHMVVRVVHGLPGIRPISSILRF